MFGPAGPSRLDNSGRPHLWDKNKLGIFPTDLLAGYRRAVTPPTPHSHLNI